MTYDEHVGTTTKKSECVCVSIMSMTIMPYTNGMDFWMLQHHVSTLWKIHQELPKGEICDIEMMSTTIQK